MTVSTDTLDGFWESSLEAAREYAHLALEGAGRIVMAHTRYLADISLLQRDKHRQFWSEHPGESLQRWLQFLETHLESTAEMAHSHLDTVEHLQNAMGRIRARIAERP